MSLERRMESRCGGQKGARLEGIWWAVIERRKNESEGAIAADRILQMFCDLWDNETSARII